MIGYDFVKCGNETVKSWPQLSKVLVKLLPLLRHLNKIICGHELVRKGMGPEYVVIMKSWQVGQDY